MVKIDTRVPVVLLAGTVLLLTGCHPWFKSRFPWEEQPDPNQKPVITNSAGETYQSGTPSFVLLIDDCMSAGGSRNECIAALPPESLARLEAMEAERGAMRRQQVEMRHVLNEGGGYQDFGFARINLPSGWLFGVESLRNRYQEDVVTARHPDGTGLLQVQSLVLPEPIGQDVLRNMTNVDLSVTLPFDNWGDYSGYQYDYVERGAYFRQWWLADGQTLVLITYQSLVELSNSDIQEVDEVVRSLRVIPGG